MMSSTECPKLNNVTKNPDLITIDTLYTLRLNTYNRTVGTVVNVSCVPQLELIGENPLTCLPNSTWSGDARCGDKIASPVLMDMKNITIISLSSIGGFLVLITVVAIIWYLLQKEKKEGDHYKGEQNYGYDTSFNSPHHVSNRHPEVNDPVFYGPKSYPPSTKRNENIHMSPITLPHNRNGMEIMEAALPRLPSTTSLDAPAPTNFKKKKYDFEEFNVYALRQGRDPFLWRPVVSNMHFES